MNGGIGISRTTDQPDEEGQANCRGGLFQRISFVRDYLSGLRLDSSVIILQLAGICQYQTG
jgi:hypothetical protein